MVKSFLRAAGTLACALVFLAGCDAVGDSGVATDASMLTQSSNAAALDIPVYGLTGPGNVCLNDINRYYAATSATGTWGPAGATEYVVATGIINGQRYADYQFTDTDPHTAEFRTSGAIFRKSVTVGICVSE